MNLIQRHGLVSAQRRMFNKHWCEQGGAQIFPTLNLIQRHGLVPVQRRMFKKHWCEKVGAPIFQH